MTNLRIVLDVDLYEPKYPDTLPKAVREQVEEDRAYVLGRISDFLSFLEHASVVNMEWVD